MRIRQEIRVRETDRERERGERERRIEKTEKEREKTEKARENDKRQVGFDKRGSKRKTTTRLGFDKRGSKQEIATRLSFGRRGSKQNQVKFEMNIERETMKERMRRSNQHADSTQEIRQASRVEPKQMNRGSRHQRTDLDRERKSERVRARGTRKRDQDYKYEEEESNNEDFEINFDKAPRTTSREQFRQ